MQLILVENIIKVASVKMKDDAFDLWINSKYENKYKAAPAAWYSKNDIDENQEYLEVNLVDEETAEATFLNVSPMMHKSMIRYKLYPLFILKCFV